jgi:hypothetical protein
MFLVQSALRAQVNQTLEVSLEGLHDNEQVLDLAGSEFVVRHQQIDKFWKVALSACNFCIHESAHDLDLPDNFYAVVLVLVDLLYQLDGDVPACLEAGGLHD